MRLRERLTAARWDGPAAGAWLRLISGLTLFSFVVCHLAAHCLLLVSIYPVAQHTLIALMAPWQTAAGTATLASAALAHYCRALWSIYSRRSLRLPTWQWMQLGMGLCIPPLLMFHVIGTRIAELALGVKTFYAIVLAWYWVMSPWYAAIHATALLVVWTHACIGIHFWLRNKPWYGGLRRPFGAIALLLPTLALAGFVSAGNQIRNEAQEKPGFVSQMRERAGLSDAASMAVYRMAVIGWSLHVALVLLAFAGRAARAAMSAGRLPLLTVPSGRTVPIRSGATVLETLREHRIPHASACGGRARCTTCRIRVTRGLEALPRRQWLEATALDRIQATADTRLACQLRPNADLSVVPLLPPDVGAAGEPVHFGLEGTERPITVMFVDLRGSTQLAETKLPYDVVFILNQFFHEMSSALAASEGRCAHFMGDGLMALYGLGAKDPASGTIQALRGAREMLSRVERLNRSLGPDLPRPLQIGIAIHFSEAIVGLMGPTGSKTIGAVGDTVNTAARLERLTKEYDCPLVLSRQAAEAAGIDLTDHALHESQVEGRTRAVQFYALRSVPDA
jgi:adenylate cyclase